MRFACYCNIKNNSTKTVRFVAKGNFPLAKLNPFAKRKIQGFDTMKIAMKDIFGSIAGLALIASPMPAFSQNVPANQNVVESPLQATAFQTSDGRDISVSGIEAGAAQASRDKIAIVVWGGTQELQQEAYNAALDLRDQGIPLAFILGPRLLPSDAVANFQVYANGEPMYEGNGASIGTAHADQVRPTVVRMGLNAYNDAFTTDLAITTDLAMLSLD